MTTWVEVADTAVKIGFGTIIGGVATLVVAWANHRRDMRKERWKRRLESLEHIADEFYAAHAEVMERIALAKYTREKLLAEGREDELAKLELNAPEGRAWFSKLVVPYRLEYSRLPLRRMYSLESRLNLLGLSEGSTMLEVYRRAAAGLETEFQSRERDQQFREAWVEFDRATSEFTAFLCSNYEA
jgi:hypothetical protein